MVREAGKAGANQDVMDLFNLTEGQGESEDIYG